MNTTNESTKNVGFTLRGFSFDYFNYKYPSIDVVPPDYYISEVIKVQETTTKNNEEAIDVFYN